MAQHFHKNAHDVVYEIMMTRASRPSAALLLVEGPDDAKLWNARVKDGSPTIVITGGRNTLLNALERIEEKKLAGVLGVADADWDRVFGRLRERVNLIYTDCHDLEVTLCFASALRKTLFEHGDEHKIRAFATQAAWTSLKRW
jgi:hypothetical protein